MQRKIVLILLASAVLVAESTKFRKRTLAQKKKPQDWRSTTRSLNPGVPGRLGWVHHAGRYQYDRPKQVNYFYRKKTGIKDATVDARVIQKSMGEGGFVVGSNKKGKSRGKTYIPAYPYYVEVPGADTDSNPGAGLYNHNSNSPRQLQNSPAQSNGMDWLWARQPDRHSWTNQQSYSMPQAPPIPPQMPSFAPQMYPGDFRNQAPQPMEAPQIQPTEVTRIHVIETRVPQSPQGLYGQTQNNPFMTESSPITGSRFQDTYDSEGGLYGYRSDETQTDPGAANGFSANSPGALYGIGANPGSIFG